MAPALHVIAGPGPGQLATMAHPVHEPWTPQELGALAKAGVEVLVSSAEPGPDTAGIEVVPFPSADSTAQEAGPVVALAIRLAREVRAGRFVVTQSAPDNGRSTLLATMTLALLGIRPGEALRRISPSGEVTPDWLHDFVANN
ncbi:hypothetical protein Ait01nite_004170 [Actinoplanes italicus]|uniref:Tyrosine phosphatase family protein n=1 Tax=Actinoplanes italicus TaxID=113567 RepID=A0A2T0KMN9_9ACTN|nr:hypothetical protein [Actinoplanes italicus]PRX24899.1 hypothetical protein CLV67_102682 [Actinoplanes italicus]GIE27372.1 hypothetical protein Ait01nite_004170 [Actinoplanes italicus]